jgi:Rrf2 family protein
MFFSKSFGYALRGILYVALAGNQKQRIQVDEIARELAVPKHFLSKVMKKVVKHGVLNSTKGPYGGFSLNGKTLCTPLFDLMIITNGDAQFENCLLRLTKCNATYPCPLHHKMEAYKAELHSLFTSTTIGDLLNVNQPDFIKSIATL